MTDLDAIRARHMWNRHGRHAGIACATCTVLAALDDCADALNVVEAAAGAAIEREARLRAALDRYELLAAALATFGEKV